MSRSTAAGRTWRATSIACRPLFATWGVWIPVVTVLYMLPEPVQIPLFSLALSLWAILYAWMSEEQARRATA